VRRALRLDLLPRLPAAQQHYWIPVLQEWAAARGLTVDYVDPLWIRLPVTRAQLMDFLGTIYGKLGDDSYFAGRGRDDKTYLLVADEF
jgi:hypothetical protein